MKPTLFSYWRSSASYRVRIALALKGIDYDQVAVNLMPGVDEQRGDKYRALNPQGRVPFYRDDLVELSQSLAIIEYLDERYPDPLIIRGDAADRARVRQLAYVAAVDIQPVQNLSVLRELKGRFGADGEATAKWNHDFIRDGLAALETLLEEVNDGAPYAVGRQPGLVDICLVPQVYNAERFKVDMTAFPIISRVVTNCREHPAFKAAAPENQPDAG